MKQIKELVKEINNPDNWEEQIGENRFWDYICYMIVVSGGYWRWIEGFSIGSVSFGYMIKNIYLIVT